MQIIRNTNMASLECVVTIGSFDGLHIGHRALIGHTISIANQYRVPAVVITFEPHPKIVLNSLKKQERLTSVREKALILKEWGVDILWLLRFDSNMASWTPEEFVQQRLCAHLRIKHMLVGDDFRFGQHREGDVKWLKRYGESIGFKVDHISTISMPEAVSSTSRRVSSTWIGELLRQGHLREVKLLLQRDYGIQVRINDVIHTPPFWKYQLHLQNRCTDFLQGTYCVDILCPESKCIKGVVKIVDNKGEMWLKVEQIVLERYTEIRFLKKLANREEPLILLEKGLYEL